MLATTNAQIVLFCLLVQMISLTINVTSTKVVRLLFISAKFVIKADTFPLIFVISNMPRHWREYS